MKNFRVIVWLPFESKEKALKEIYYRVPNGIICSIREVNGNKPRQVRLPWLIIKKDK